MRARLRRLLCRIVGHRLERLPDTQEGEWWREHWRCTRCGGTDGDLVAGQEG